jgi:DNA-binding transcriptional ArsR family regulator
MQLVKGLKVLASPTRLRVLELLKDPAAFEGPRDANGRAFGVTAKALLKQLRCTQPSLNEQMQVLIGLGLVESRKVGRWVVYTRDEERIRQLKQTIIDQL